MQEGVTTRKRRREEISTPVVSSSVITVSNVTDASSVPVHVPEPEPVVIEQPRYETVLADKLEQPSSHVVDIKTENNLSEMISDTMTDETKHIVLPLLSGAESHTNKESSITTHLVHSTSNQNQINSVQDTKHSSSATTTTTNLTSMSTRSDSHGILSNAALSSSTTATAAAASASVPSLPTGTEVYMSAAQATSAIYSRSINPFSTQFALATLSWAPLHLASLKGDISLVRALCSSGVHVNARTVTDGKTALAIAVEQGFIAIVDELLQRGGAM